MCISLGYLIADMTLPDMVYYRAKNRFFESKELDLYRLHQYKDYVYLPYIKESAIYDAFLDSFHLVKEKKELHQKENFDVEFRKFINHNKKYDHDLSGYYADFETEYLKPIAIDWCRKNHIKYTDNT